MGCCLSKKPSPSPSAPSISHTNVRSCAAKVPDPSKHDVNKPIKPVTELQKNPETDGAKPISEKVDQEGDGTTKEELVIKHRKSHERSKKTESDESSASVVVEKSVVRSSSCTKEEVDAILIQCGKMSRSNSAAKTRRYSGSKRSFDFDQNEKIHGGDVEEEQDVERRTPRHRHRGVDRVNGSPRERRRRTPSREREDSKSYRPGSRERGNGRRVSRSPGKRSEINPKLNSSGVSVNSSNIRPGKFVTVPATDKSNNNGEPLVTRITVKRNIGEACRIAASPRSKSPASIVQAPPSLSRSSSRKAEQSPYRRNPLGEIDQNTSKGDKIGSGCNKKMIYREKETVNNQKPSTNCNKKTIRAPSPTRESATELVKPQVTISRSRSLRKSRDFDFSPETLLSNEDNTSNYTALLLKDIQNFHGKSNVDDDPSISFNLLPSCVTKACSIVEAVADLNSTTNNTCLSSDSSHFRFTSTAKKADLMEPSFEKYVTVKRGGSLEGQESSGSNNLT